MALVKCPECNKKISVHAISCPDCSYPLEKMKLRAELAESQERQWRLRRQQETDRSESLKAQEKLKRDEESLDGYQLVFMVVIPALILYPIHIFFPDISNGLNAFLLCTLIFVGCGVGNIVGIERLAILKAKGVPKRHDDSLLNFYRCAFSFLSPPLLFLPLCRIFVSDFSNVLFLVLLGASLLVGWFFGGYLGQKRLSWLKSKQDMPS